MLMQPSTQRTCPEARAVARDDKGEYIAAASWFISHVSSVDSAELVAIRYGLILAANIRCHSIILESDSSNAVEIINQEVYLGHDVSIYMECKQLGAEFSKVDVIHCCREANAVADAIAKNALSSRSSSVWDDVVTAFVSHQIGNDLAII